MARDIAEVIAIGRRQAAWSLNAVMSAVYWDMGRQIVEFEQKGSAKAQYAERVIDLLSLDLTARFGRGFRRSNLFQIRRFYLAYQNIVQTLSGQFERAREYRLVLPDEAQLAAEIGKTRKLLERRRQPRLKFQTVSGKSARRR